MSLEIKVMICYINVDSYCISNTITQSVRGISIMMYAPRGSGMGGGSNS